MCLTFSVVIGSSIQDGWRAIVNWLLPILDEIIPDLAVKAIGVRDEVPKMLGMMPIRESVIPFARRMLRKFMNLHNFANYWYLYRTV